MTVPTREEVVQWADESVFDIVKADCYHEFDEVADSGNLWITKRLTDFATLARADLEATVKDLEARLDLVTHERNNLIETCMAQEAAVKEQSAEIDRLVIACADHVTVRSEQCHKIAEQAAEIEQLKALSVTNILVDIVPGDGSGHEIYASSLKDVQSLITRLSEKADDYDLVTVPLRQQLAAAQEDNALLKGHEIEWLNHLREVSDQLAAAQLRNEQLREALEFEHKSRISLKYAPLCSTLDALSTQPDLSALEAERQRVAEACAKVCRQHPDGLNMLGGGFVACAEAIDAGQWREHRK